MTTQTIFFYGWKCKIKIDYCNSFVPPIIILSSCKQKINHNLFQTHTLGRTIYTIDFSNHESNNSILNEKFNFMFLAHLINEIIYYFNLDKIILICLEIDCIIGVLLNVLNKKKFLKIIFYNPVLPLYNFKTIILDQKMKSFNWQNLKFHINFISKLKINFNSEGLKRIICWNLNLIDNLHLIVDSDWKIQKREQIQKIYQSNIPKVFIHWLTLDNNFQQLVQKIIIS